MVLVGMVPVGMVPVGILLVGIGTAPPPPKKNIGSYYHLVNSIGLLNCVEAAQPTCFTTQPAPTRVDLVLSVFTLRFVNNKLIRTDHGQSIKNCVPIYWY